MKIQISKLLIILGLIYLWGCAKYSPTPTRDILVSNQIAEDGYGAYGYLVFTKRPSDSIYSRYYAICDAYLNNLEPNEKYRDFEKSYLMPTYWLVTDTVNFNKNSRACSNWIDNYDYARAKILASLVKKLDVEGPLFIAWSKPYENADEGEEALVLDLSNFADEDLNRAFGIWMNQITKDPNIWNDGFNLILVRENFRNFLEKYGGSIVDSIKTVKNIFS
jgi:hypothetical protein